MDTIVTENIGGSGGQGHNASNWDAGDGGSGGNGGGVFIEKYSTLVNSIISNNRGGAGQIGQNAFGQNGGDGGSGGSGGAIYALSSVGISNCVFKGNSGGIGAASGLAVIIGGATDGNGGNGGSGGAIRCITNCTVVSSLITDNYTGMGGNGNKSTAGAGGSGGGLCVDGSLIVLNCTILENSTKAGGTGGINGNSGNGGGIAVSGSADILNSIVVDNSVAAGGQGGDICGNAAMSSRLSYSCVNNTYNVSGSSTGMITASVSTLGFVNSTSNNYHLSSISICVNAGLNDNLVEIIDIAGTNMDLDGLSRIYGGIVDVGAYEFTPKQEVNPRKGPYLGGNVVQITNCEPNIGNGFDITNICVGTAGTTNIAGQGTNWVLFVAPSNTDGVKDLLIQSASVGNTVYDKAYTVNPAGQIGVVIKDWTQWQEVASLPGARYQLAAGVLNDALYAVGGWDSGNAVKTNVYRFDGTSWAEIAGLPAARRFLAVAALDDALYAIGGLDDNDSAKTNVYRYNGVDWKEVSGLPVARTELAAGVLNGALYAIGGLSTNVYRYNGTNWTEVVGLPAPRTGLAAGVLNGMLYAVGGYNTPSVCRLNMTGWQEIAGLPAVRSYLAAGVLNGSLYAIGGGDNSLNRKATVYKYNETGWLEAASLPSARMFLAASVLDSCIYAIGGGGWDIGAQSNVYRYPRITAVHCGVHPSSGSCTGGYTVVITGSNLGDGMDVTNVILSGINVAGIISQSSTQIVVMAGAAATIGAGSVNVFSTSFGETVKSNAFTYTDPGLQVLSPNGTTIINGEGASSAKGTDFGAIPRGQILTNYYILTNTGNAVLTISDVTTSGAGASVFSLPGSPFLISAGNASNITVTFAPIAAQNYTCTVSIVNNSTNSPFMLNLAGMGQKLDQTITFPNPGDQSITNTVCLYATASSDLDVTFILTGGSANISDGTNLSFSGAGPVSVVASQAGDDNWNPAPNVTNSFNGIKALASVMLENLTHIYDGKAKSVLAKTVPPGLLVDVTYAGNNWAPTNIGSYAVACEINEVLYQGSTNGMLIINALPAPVVLEATLIAPNNFTANWGAVDTATNYFLDVASVNDFSSCLDGFSNYLTGSNVSCTVTGVNAGNTYYCRVRAQNSGMISSNSETISVIIRAIPAMGVPVVSNIMSHTAYLGGIVTASNGCSITERGIYWGTNSGSVCTDGMKFHERSVFGTDPFSYFVTNLPSGRTNYFLAYAVNLVGTNYTEEASFLTRPDAPAILAPTNLTEKSLDANWQLAAGAANYWLDVAPTNDFKSYLPGYSNRMVGLALNCSVTGLETKVAYYYRVRAENNTGISTNSTVMQVPRGAIRLLPMGLTYASVYGEADPAEQNYIITNSGYWNINISNIVKYSTNASGWWRATPEISSLAGLSMLTITGNVTVTGLNVGTYYVTNEIISSEATNSPQYLVATLTVSKGNQTITNFTPADGSSMMTTNVVRLFAQASSGLTVTNFAVISGPGVISWMTNLTFTNSGIVIVTAGQTGDINWNAAPTVTNTFNVSKETALVSLTNMNQIYDGTPQLVEATTVPDGLPVFITYNGRSTPPTAAGIYAVNGVVYSDLYQGSAHGTLTVSKATAKITLNNLNQTYNGAARNITAMTVPANLAVLITYDGSIKAPVNSGSYAIIVTISEVNYQGFANSTLIIAKANQIITFPAIPDQKVASVITLSATANSSMTISYDVKGPAVLNGNILSFTGTGAVSIIASQAGNSNWNTALNVIRNFTVNANKRPSVPVDIQASDGGYNDKVRVIWSAAGGAAAYQIWRNTTSNSGTASHIATITDTLYDDTNVVDQWTYYYWIKAGNSAGESEFSDYDTGYCGVIGPLLSVNDLVGGKINITAGTPLTIAVEMMNLPEAYIGYYVDWWVAAYAQTGNAWYYLTPAMGWMPFDGNLTNIHPVFQGPLSNLPQFMIVQDMTLAPGRYNIWFAVDYPMDGILRFIPASYLLDDIEIMLETHGSGN